ncbi:MAG TPA: hypothetical protein VFG88_10030 [Nocardioidaceae bacterium]|nr:hypothetical protein [Nocardioidaceae bacterium]
MPLVHRLLALIKHALVFEINIYVSLLRWVLHRPSVPTGFEPVGYSRLVAPTMGLWIFGSALELPLVHVLVPWHGLRIALLLVGVWGLLWMVGALAGLRCYPHLLGEHALRVRNGPTHDIQIPWQAIATVTSQDRSLLSSLWTLQTEETDEGTRLDVAVSGRVNVELRFAGPLPIQTKKGATCVTSLGLWVDEPGAVARELRRRAGSAAPRR